MSVLMALLGTKELLVNFEVTAIPCYVLNVNKACRLIREFKILAHLNPSFLCGVGKRLHPHFFVLLSSVLVNHKIQAIPHDHGKLYRAIGDTDAPKKAARLHPTYGLQMF